MAVDGLVDAVVDDLPEQVMEARRVGAADVHAGPLSYRLQALQDLDAVRIVRPAIGRLFALYRLYYLLVTHVAFS